MTGPKWASFELKRRGRVPITRAPIMPFTSLNRRLLASTIASVGVYAGFGGSYITATTAVALGLAAIFATAASDPTLTVKDRCLMNKSGSALAPCLVAARWRSQCMSKLYQVSRPHRA